MTDTERIRVLELMLGDYIVEQGRMDQIILDLSERVLELTNLLGTEQWNHAVTQKVVAAVKEEKDWYEMMYRHERGKNA